MSTLHVGVAGAGLLGRLFAWSLGSCGHTVDVFDPAQGPDPTFDGSGAAAFTAAGMLSPTAELDVSTVGIAQLGWRSIDLWSRIFRQLPNLQNLATSGSLLVAHGPDRGSAERVLSRLGRAPASMPAAQPLSAAQLHELEPSLAQMPHAWLLPGEAWLDPPCVMASLHTAASGLAVHWTWQRLVSEVKPGRLRLSDGQERCYDLVIDARGVGARGVAAPDPGTSTCAMSGTVTGAPRADDADNGLHGGQCGGVRARSAIDEVRGVRGETVWLSLADHGLRRPVRLLHPRHRVYLVPRSPDLVVVGASELESEDRSPVSLRSAVELMAAAHSVMPALAEARILRLDRNLRPALPDNEPAIEFVNGLLRVNGLFRHGWLLAPALVVDALRRAGLALPACFA